MFKKIAVAFDESPEAERAFREALDLAKLAAADLSIITVIENLPPYMSYVSAVAPDVLILLKNQRRSFYEDLHNTAKSTAEQSGLSLQSYVVEGDEVAALLQVIGQIQPDVLVVGLRREPGGLGRFLGGTAHQLALHAKCSILGIH